MDSLLANYVSSDEEEDQEEEEEEAKPTAFASKPTSEHTQPKPSSSKISSLFTSLPQAKQSPSLPKPQPPKPTSQFSQATTKPSSIFSSLPQVKSEFQQQPISIPSSSDPKPKRVVQFKPPITRSSIKSFDSDDEDDDREEKELKQRKQLEIAAQNSSVESFLSRIPAPKSSGTLGVLASSSSGRRAVVETDAPVSNAGSSRGENESGIDHNIGNYTANYANYDLGDQNVGSNSVNYDSYANYDLGTDQNANVDDQSQYVMSGSGSGSGSLSYGGYGRYASYGDYGQHGTNLADGSATTVPEMSGMGESGFRVGGKRGRNEVPVEIVEVNQDELIKNRPREDQVKLTGIAFGPSYQPVSTKGKPTKLHKRKHQIGSLYFDMRQKETELAERRARGFLTKAETQAKYGW